MKFDAASLITTRHAMETLIAENASNDPDFRRELLAAPKFAIEKFLGRKLLQDVTIHIHEEDDHTMHMTLPAPPPNLPELSDEELERAASGADNPIAIFRAGS